jgi:hypothetical protein
MRLCIYGIVFSLYAEDQFPSCVLKEAMPISTTENNVNGRVNVVPPNVRCSKDFVPTNVDELEGF